MSHQAGDTVQVFSGVYKGFNQWEAGKGIGAVGTKADEIRVIGADSKVLTPTFPYQADKSQPVSPVHPAPVPGSKSK